MMVIVEQLNVDWKGKSKYSEKTCLSATLSTTNPTLQDQSSNPSRRDGKPADNSLSYGAALKIRWILGKRVVIMGDY
jgi:hypothetical protein